MLGIVVSREDSASVAVGEQLLALADWTESTDDGRPDADGGGTVYRLSDAELRTFDDLHIRLEGVDEAFSDAVALLAVASRHSGETGPLLTAHPTGNFGPADYGGAAGRFARAAPNAHRRTLAAFDDHAPDGYEVGTEATHHGPTDVDVPSLFVELGSGEAEWSDPEGARAVARSILALRGVAPDAERTVVGFGGGHYAPRFERIVRETDWAVGHVAADWALDAMDGPDPAVFERAIERSGATRAIVEGDRPGLERRIEALGCPVVSETWLRATTGVPLALVERVEREVERVEDGLRFGAQARGAGVGADVGFRTVDLPEELLAAANGVDADRVLAAVRERALAVGTDEGGTRLAGPVVLADRSRSAVVDALADVLATDYEAVERRDGELVVRERAFDPGLARELGVEEGPAFGRLSNGQKVETNGRTVSPEDVHRVRERRFSLG